MWRDDACLLDMLIHARRARSFTESATLESFLSDALLQAATLHVLQIVGEAASKVSSEFQGRHPEIAWERIISLRHRLVHDYPRIELPKIWTVVRDHIPPLVVALEPLVPPDSEGPPTKRIGVQ
jgi:uncharacterized protein with HEPN domain